MHLRVHSVRVTKQQQNWEETLVSVGEAIVGDEFGCAKLKATDNQLNIVKQGQAITIRNAHANVVKEHILIELDKWSKVETSNVQVTDKVLLTNNLSDIAYE